MSDSESAASMSESESRRTKFETRRSNHEAQRRHDADESADDYESNSDGNNGIYISDDDHYAEFESDNSGSEDGEISDQSSSRPSGRYDPTEEDKPQKLGGGMRDYVYKHFTRHIKDDVIKDKILKENPVPQNSIFTAPQLDEFVEELVSDKKAIMYTKIHDGSIKFIQKRIGQVMGPLTKIWKVVDEGVNGNADAQPSMGIDELLKLIEMTILLLGQANVACLYERRLNVLAKIFGDAKKARKSIFANEAAFTNTIQSKLLGDDYYKVLEKHSKSKKRAREISESITTRPAKRRNLDNDNYRERNNYSQRRPFRSGPSRRGRGGRSSYRGHGQRWHHDKRYAKPVCHSKVRGNSTKSTFRYRKSGVERPPAKVKTSSRRRAITPFRNKLGNDNTGYGNSRCNKGVQDRICSGTDAKSKQTLFYEIYLSTLRVNDCGSVRVVICTQWLGMTVASRASSVCNWCSFERCPRSEQHRFTPYLIFYFLAFVYILYMRSAYFEPDISKQACFEYVYYRMERPGGVCLSVHWSFLADLQSVETMMTDTERRR